MTAEEFLTSFRARGFRILMKDGLRVEPFPKLTTADRAAIAEVAADEGARTTLERLLREHAENSGEPAKAAKTAKPATPAAKPSAADVVVFNAAQKNRRQNHKPDLTVKVIERDPVPPSSQGSSSEQPAAARETEILDEVVETSASEVVEPSTQDDQHGMTLKIDASDIPEPVYEAETQLDRSQRILLWVTAEIVRSRRTGRLLIELKVHPSPSTITDGDRPVSVSFESMAASAPHRFEVLMESTNLGRDGLDAHGPRALRMGIELWR
jgi:hypothetical protein